MANNGSLAQRTEKPVSAKKTSTNSNREIKILMLHGYTQSGPLFHAKTRALEKMLQKSLASSHITPLLIYPTAPNRLRYTDIPGFKTSAGNPVGDDDEPDSWAWWRRDDATGAFKLFSEGMGSLSTTITDAGGIDGVIGFSQGGAAAALLAAALEQPPRQQPADTTDGPYDWSWVSAVQEANKNQPLKFAVVYSGFFALPNELLCFYEPPIATPTLHYLGCLDTVVDESRSQALVDKCVNPVVLSHPGGHYVPISKEWAAPLVGFILKNCVLQPESQL